MGAETLLTRWLCFTRKLQGSHRWPHHHTFLVRMHADNKFAGFISSLSSFLMTPHVGCSPFQTTFKNGCRSVTCAVHLFVECSFLTVRMCALVLFFNFSWKVRFQNQAKVGYSSQNCTSPSWLFDCTFLAEVLSLYFHHCSLTVLTHAQWDEMVLLEIEVQE